MRIVTVVMVVVVLALSGCEKKDAARNANGYSNAFKAKMESGQTTREQEQQFIRACAGLCYELDRSVRGTKKADETKAAAVASPDATINPVQKMNTINLDAVP